MAKSLPFAVCLFLFLPQALWAAPAFPGAEGFGAATPGGRGGQVLFVTNLNDAGAGSFRQALMTSGKRIIVFKVSGVIKLATQLSPEADNLSYFYVAGQTSPGGITITMDNGSPVFQYTANRLHDAVWRFLRFRLIRTSGGNGGDQSFEQYQSHDFIIDHCDFSGADDECFDIGYSRNFTVQWSTIANSGPGGQRYGALIAYTNPPTFPLGHFSLHHNLIANHSKRGPEMHWLWKQIPDSGQVDFRSNMIYNVDQYGTAFWGCTTQVLIANVVGNYWKVGPANSYNYFPPVNAERGVRLYIKDNFWNSPGKSTAIGYNITDPNDPDTVVCKQYGSQPVLVSTPWNFPPVTTHAAKQTFDTVLARVGAWPRDSMNARTVRQVKAGTGGLGECYDSLIRVGPAASADADNDGMPDFWETGMGLNSSGASDNTGDLDGDGYTNVEEYINDVALARLCQDYYNAVYPIPSDWPDYNPSCSKSLALEAAGPAVARPAGLSVSPNPVRGRAVIAGVFGETPVQIWDMRGRKVARLVPGPGGVAVWEPGPLPAGVYLLRVKTGDRERVKRLFLER